MESFKLGFPEYYDKVFDYMEYLGVPDLVIYFREKDVSDTFAKVIAASFLAGISTRIAAIVLWGISYRKCALSASNGERIH